MVVRLDGPPPKREDAEGLPTLRIYDGLSKTFIILEVEIDYEEEYFLLRAYYKGVAHKLRCSRVENRLLFFKLIRAIDNDIKKIKDLDNAVVKVRWWPVGWSPSIEVFKTPKEKS